LAILLRGKEDEIYNWICSDINLNEINLAFRRYQSSNPSSNFPELISDTVLDVMTERFDYRSNEYPFLMVAYITRNLKRLDEFILPSTDPNLVYEMKTSW